MSMSESLITNNLVYSLPTPSSAAISRQQKRNYFDNRTYQAGQTARVVCQTGSQYIDTLSSSLVVKVKIDSDATTTNWSWGKGSAINLLKNVRVYSSSGVEISNILGHNIHQCLKDKYTEDGEWMATQGELCGYNSPGSAGVVANGETYEFHIPLSKVSPVFNPLGKQLAPPMLMSGLICEVELESSENALLQVSGTGNLTYSISDIYLNLSCTTLSDFTVQSLNDIAAKQLLEWSFIDVYSSKQTQSAANGLVALTVNKAVSFADKIIVSKKAQATSQSTDNFSFPDVAGAYQFTLGSTQLPSNVHIDSQPSRYFEALSTYNKIKDRQHPCQVTLGEFNQNSGIDSCSFSKDQMLALSQLTISSSRSLRYEFSYDAAPSEAQVINLFLSYIKVARLSLSDCKIDL